MASAKKPRKKRVVDPQKKAEKHERNLKHEIRIAEKKINKLLKRNKLGKPATSGKKKVWDDAHKEVVKVLELQKKQGFARDSERFNKMALHIENLKKDLNKK